MKAMTNKQAQELLDKVIQKWPGYSPTDEEMSSWLEMFKHLEYHETLDALQSAWECSEYPTPRPGMVTRFLRQQRAGRVPSSGRVDVGYSGLWVQCTVAHPAFPTRLGWYVPVIFMPRGKLPPLDDYQRLADADKMRQDHQRTYGGTWVVVREATPEQMAQSRQSSLERAGLVGPVKPRSQGKIRVFGTDVVPGRDVEAMARPVGGDDGAEPR